MQVGGIQSYSEPGSEQKYPQLLANKPWPFKLQPATTALLPQLPYLPLADTDVFLQEVGNVIMNYQLPSHS
jgi:hypothetical protein